MLVIMMGVRKALDWVFTKNEMKILDDVLPEHKRTERLDDDAEPEEDKTLPGAPGIGPEDNLGKMNYRFLTTETNSKALG